MTWTPDDATVEKAARAAKPYAWKEDGHFNSSERRWRRDASLTEARAALLAVVPDIVAEADLYRKFHNAWVEAEVSCATGVASLAAEKRDALLNIHHAIRTRHP